MAAHFPVNLAIPRTLLTRTEAVSASGWPVRLAEVQARGLNQLDRKILRSGLFNQFETPTADDQKAN